MGALAISANRRYLAASECGETATITVFDLQHEQGRRRKVLSVGDTPVEEFLCMAFSPDSKYLISQTGAPEWILIFWLWEKNKVLATVKTTTSTNPITQVSHYLVSHSNVQAFALDILCSPIRSASTLTTTYSCVRAELVCSSSFVTLKEP